MQYSLPKSVSQVKNAVVEYPLFLGLISGISNISTYSLLTLHSSLKIEVAGHLKEISLSDFRLLRSAAVLNFGVTCQMQKQNLHPSK